MQTLLKKLNKSNIKIDLVDEKLDIQAPKGVMTADLLNEIKLHKNDLIEFITLHKTKKEKFLFIPQIPIQSSYVLSSSQRRLWLLSQINEANTAYNMPSVFELKGNITISFLEKSFSALIKRHESLRTVFKEDESGEVRQIILEAKDNKFQLQFEDISIEENSLEITKAIIQKEINYSFDLSSDSLVRAKLVKTSQDTFVFICVMHHIISDGQSAEVMTNELFSLYEGYVNGWQNSLPALKLQYKDYAAWQQDQLINDDIESHKSYWLQQFEGELPIFDLAAYKIRPAIKTYNGKSVNKVYNESLVKDFSDLCQSQDCTLFMGLLASVKMLLYKYTNQNDIVIGSPIAGREHVDLQNQIGLYINTLALRTKFDGKDSFKELLSNVKHVTLGAYEHQIYPFDELIEHLSLKRDMSRNPLFDVMVALQDIENLKVNIQRLGEIDIEEYEVEEALISKFDLGFTFHKSDKGLGLTLTYNTDIYSEEFVKRILNHLEILLLNIIQKSDKDINSLSYLTNEEKQQVLVEFNNTKVDYPENKTLVDLFEEQVSKTPNNIAVVFEEIELTYKELNEKSNQLAYYLRENYSIEPDDLIGIKLDRSEMMIIAILGILKSGAAYVPIDINYPEERIAYMEKDSNSKVVVDEAVLERFNEVHEKYLKGNIEKINQPNDLAYVIYTSGTTGNPKGVMVEYRNIVNYILHQINFLKIISNERIALLSSISFDASVEQIFIALLSSSTLCIIKRDDQLDSEKLASVLAKNAITHLHSISSLLINLNLNSISTLRRIISAGEDFKSELVDKSIGNCILYNKYGPTEITISSTIGQIINKNFISIGKPISNTQIYILNEELTPVPVGIAGNIYISGLGITRGYLNKPELTAEKFISNPFIKGTRIYHTGDLGFWLPDGSIEFLGRKDQQIKMRGHRIELGEIENTIFQYSKDLVEVVVAVKERNNEKVLVAYFVSTINIDKSELRSFLQEKLPDYMIPIFYLDLDSVPLTSNGKTDREALPSIFKEDITIKKYFAPTTENQLKLTRIWQEILGVQKVGIRDNFFVLGGHSLIVSQVINRAYKDLGINISFRDFFSNPTIEGLSKNLRETHYLPIPKATEAISYPLTSAQNRLWILSQLEGGSVAYNMPFALRIKGDINFQIFQKSFHNLIQRHEILRTYFKKNEKGEIRQYVVFFEAINFVIDQFDFSDKLNIEKELEGYLQLMNNESFDLDKVPLIRASLIKITEEEHVFFFSKHHIIGDGWSSQIIISEVVKTYNVLIQGKEINLPELNIQYKDYAVWLNEELQQEKHQASEQYWLQQFSGELPVLDLPSFKVRPLIQTYNGDSLTHTFSKAFLEKLKIFSKEHDVTLFMSLMAGINSLLHRYTGQDDIIVGTPIAGREHLDLENQLGLYLNTLAIRTKFNETGSFLDLVLIQKETLLDAYEHQSYPFDELVGKLKLKRNTSRSPLFDVMVVLQNQGQLNNVNNEGELNGLQVEDYDFRRKTSQFDINFIFVETEGLDLTIEYNTDIYDDYLIERMFAHFENLMTHAINNSKDSILSLDYITEKEKKELLEEFNNTTIDYPKEMTIVELFEEQVIKTPDNIAVVFEGQKLTYTELNKQANQLAQYLRKEYAIKPDDLIGIKLERSEQLLVAILAILKSGAAYVPIDSTYPQARIDYIEKDINSKINIDQEVLKKFNIVKEKYLKSNLEKNNQTSDLAYVIYTSGTSGTPKGVMVEHRNVIRLVKPCSFFPLNEEKTLLSTGSISFDASIIEYFGTLLNGSKLILAKQENLLDLGSLLTVIQQNKVNSLWMTASWFNQVVENKINVFETISQLIVGGDVVSPIYIFKVFNKYPNIKIVNGYGPTENSTFSTTFIIENKKYINIPIGSPIPNSKAYILDDTLNIVPLGVIGKIYVSGAGVSRGYLNQRDLTKQKFIENPFIKGEKMYDTGDIGRWLPEGNIEFLGRKDKQIKIRGYRIELGEIENTILQYSDTLKQIVVEAKEVKEEKLLVAYITSDVKLDKEAVRKFLLGKLPDYMIPSFYVELLQMPLTHNGKIDRKSLPAISVEDVVRKEYVPPRTAIEHQLVLIWEEVLIMERIGITDNFFEIGGNSLMIVKIIDLIYKKLNKKISFNEVFTGPTIEVMCKKLKKYSFTKILKYSELTTYPLTPAQKRMWISCNYKNINCSYNVPIITKLNFLDEFKIKNIFKLLLLEHEILRTNFLFIPEISNINQIVRPIEQIEIDVLQKSFSDNIELSSYVNKQLKTGFNLQKDLLVKIFILTTDENIYLFVKVHHIITDGKSIKLLISEFQNMYYNNITNLLHKNDIQYKDYSIWINEQRENYDFRIAKEYWINDFKTNNNLRQSIYAKNRISDNNVVETMSIKFSKNEFDDLLNFSKINKTTKFLLLLTLVPLNIYSNCEIKDLVIGIPEEGRNHSQLLTLQGMFVNTLPIKSDIDLDHTFLQFLKKQEDKFLKAQEFNLYQFEDLIEDLNLNRKGTSIPIIDLLLTVENFEHEYEEDFKLNKSLNQFNLSYNFYFYKNCFELEVRYNSDLYKRGEINKLINGFNMILNLVVENKNNSRIIKNFLI